MTKNTRLRIVAVCVVLGGFAALTHACGDTLNAGADNAFAPEFAANPTGGIEPVSPETQTSLAGTRVPADPTVRVLNRNGRPIEGQLVLFQILTGTGSVTTSTVRSDGAGLASVGWTLGPEVGEQSLRASIPRRPPVDFRATATAPTPPPPAAVAITPDAHEFNALGQTVRLTAAVSDASGSPLNAGVTWRSLAPAIASVDTTGTVLAARAGQTWVVAETQNGIADSARILVTQAIVAVAVSPALDTIDVNGTSPLTATARDANGHVVPNTTFTWSSAQPAIATVDPSGLVTGRSAGSVFVGAAAGGGAGSAQMVVRAPAPPPPPPPGNARILFHSDWSTATGSSMAALLDGNKAIPWSYILGNGRGDVVVANTTALDFPTANVYHSVAQARSGGVMAENPKLNPGHMPTLAVGQTRAWRWYFRMTVPDAIDPTGSTPHPIQDSGAGDFNFEFRFEVNRNGTFRPGFGFDHTAYPNNRYTLAAPLPKNRTYRFELRITRTGTTTFTALARVYDSSGNLVHDSGDFRNGNGTGSGSLADAPQLTLGNAALLSEFQVGSNGPGWFNVPASAFPFTLWYTGGVAVCADDWCGPYRSGEGS